MKLEKLVLIFSPWRTAHLVNWKYKSFMLKPELCAGNPRTEFSWEQVKREFTYQRSPWIHFTTLSSTLFSQDWSCAAPQTPGFCRNIVPSRATELTLKHTSFRIWLFHLPLLVLVVVLKFHCGKNTRMGCDCLEISTETSLLLHF